MREICMSGSTRGREGRGFTPLPPVLLYRSSVAIYALFCLATPARKPGAECATASAVFAPAVQPSQSRSTTTNARSSDPACVTVFT